MAGNTLTHWTFDGRFLLPPDALLDGLSAEGQCLEWRARSGGLPPNPTDKKQPPDSSLHNGFYRPLPEGWYTIVQTKKENHPWIDPNSPSGYKDGKEQYGAAGGGVYGKTLEFQERPGDEHSAWFVPLIAQKDPDSGRLHTDRGHTEGLGRLGIHPDGAAKGSAGCIAVMPINTVGDKARNLSHLFNLLVSCKQTSLRVEYFYPEFWWEHEPKDWQKDELPWKCAETRHIVPTERSLVRFTGNVAEYTSVIKKI